MKPLIEEVLADRIEEFIKHLDCTEVSEPQEQAYIKVEKRSFVLGEFASQLHVEETLFDKKYEYGLYKVLAAIGVVLQKYQVKTKEPLDVWVGVLLPWNEYKDKERFQGRLAKLAKSYKFRDNSIKLNLIPNQSIVVLPEGAGTAAAFMIENMSLFNGKKVGIAMFGYQNLTGLVFENGFLKTGKSPKIGMSLFLDWVIERTSGLDRQKLLKAVNKSIESIEIDEYALRDNVKENGSTTVAMSSFPVWSKLKAPQKLTTTTDPILRKQEIRDICQVLEIVSKEYRARVRKWLSQMFPTEEFDCLFVSGGAAKFLQQEIEQHCNSFRRVDEVSTEDGLKHKFDLNPSFDEYLPLGDSEDHIKLISDRVLLKKVVGEYAIAAAEIEKMSLDIRLVDNYGSMQRLFKKEEKYQAKLRSERASKAAKASVAARKSQVGQAP